jgi:preprotein translocase subunit SecA
MRELERRVVLSVLDRKWREHLYEMDYLQEGIGLRAYSQKDPLVEYQREGYELFTAMMDSIKEESVGYLFNVEVQVEEPGSDEVELTPMAAPALGAAAQAAEVEAAEVDAAPQSAPSISAKGLGPQRPQRLEYSAPSVDGEAGVVRAAEDLDEVPELGPDASRAERRRAERAQRKKDQRKS